MDGYYSGYGGHYRGRGGYRGYYGGHGRYYGGYGGFFPGLFIGGVLGWGFGQAPITLRPIIITPPRLRRTIIIHPQLRRIIIHLHLRKIIIHLRPKEVRRHRRPAKSRVVRCSSIPAKVKVKINRPRILTRATTGLLVRQASIRQTHLLVRPDAQTTQKSSDYFRAISACLDGRGYTLR